MATLTDLATRALKRCNAEDPDENPTANESSQVVELINEMLAEWEAQDCDLGLSLPLAASATITDQLQISAIVANAAVRAAGLFGLPVTVMMDRQAYETKSALQNSLETLANVSLDQALLDAGKRRDTEIL